MCVCTRVRAAIADTLAHVVFAALAASAADHVAALVVAPAPAAAAAQHPLL